MGVKGLESYMENVCDDVCYNVSIKELANIHRRTLRRNEKPTIVVDGMGLVYCLYARYFDWVYGGQWKEFLSLLQTFIQKFKFAGIKLVFFFDGFVCPEKRQEWVSRRIGKAKEIEAVFRKLKQTGKQPNKKLIPAFTCIMTRFALKYCCNAEVYNTVKEADFEIAEYAKTNHQVFAILGQDTDFVIFDTKPYLSLKNLKLHNLTTVVYDRQSLASRLRLTISQLPLLSCPLGNDVIPFEMVIPFHKKNCPASSNIRIEDVMIMVKNTILQNRWSGDFRDTRQLHNICLLVFGSTRNVDLLREGIMFYFLTAARSRVSLHLRAANDSHINCENFPAIYGLLSNLEFDSVEVLEDYTDVSLPPANLVFRPVRQRAYSCLFSGRSQNISIKEWCFVPRKDFSNPDIVKPLPVHIKGGIPSLDYLWSDKSPKANDIKLECLFACLGGALKPQHIRGIKQKYIALCCIMNYLLSYGKEKQPLLDAWEVAAFIAQAVSPRADDVEWIKSLQVRFIDTRAVQLASLLLCGVDTFGVVLGICGYPLPVTEIMPWNFFNGKLFHWKYLCAKAGARVNELCENEGSVIREFYSLLSVAILGTSLVHHSLFQRTR